MSDPKLEFRILERLKQAALDIRRNGGGGDDVDWKLNQSVSRILNSFIDNEERSSPTGLTEWTSNPSIHVAWWMMQRGYATGHGDTLDDLLSELVHQAAVLETSQDRKDFFDGGKEFPKPTTEGAQIENACSPVSSQHHSGE
ncbi:hypothetical protein ACWAT4_21785 [Bradyrhizobium manausense]